MASLVELERNGQLDTVPRDEIPWEQIRQNLEYRLIAQGKDREWAEETADDAICRTYVASDERMSEVRAWSDARRNLATIRRAERERVASVTALLAEQEELIASNAGRRAIDQRTPQCEMASVREAIKDDRFYRLLLDLFSQKYWPVYPAEDARW